ncbi:lactoylglutathione lyase-like protein [Halalkaliarchaeum desulfuricum]|uniref:Lactoylglutathione lyase-like protein n=1 Tax=Halalkaliarchaeum desulfuricum TaxID=2055893 RepID=A0A343TKY8_9EURY|nr:VOC family protein [Halalkaliarchaeum desulfuricum]AUX09760.1 lactoylglutathione lyase-like protein [Halalkaliarchaeum desulfuricum]
MIPEDVPQLDVTIPEITQVAFVVEDLDDGMNRFGGILGVDEWDVYRFEPPRLTNRTYRGEPHDYGESRRKPRVQRGDESDNWESTTGSQIPGV